MQHVLRLNYRLLFMERNVQRALYGFDKKEQKKIALHLNHVIRFFPAFIPGLFRDYSHRSALY